MLLPPETLPVSLLSPQSPGQPRGQPPRLRATSKKDGEQFAGSGRRNKKHPEDSSSPLTATNKTSGSGAPVQGYVAELSAQARESLRWEGVLEDPHADEKRLELYRANRRQRYLSHREALLKETQYWEDFSESLWLDLSNRSELKKQLRAFCCHLRLYLFSCWSWTKEKMSMMPTEYLDRNAPSVRYKMFHDCPRTRTGCPPAEWACWKLNRGFAQFILCFWIM